MPGPLRLTACEEAAVRIQLWPGFPPRAANGAVALLLRRRSGSLEDLLSDDKVTWAKETWRDRAEGAKLHGGGWMLREAASALGISEGEVDKVVTFAREES